MNNKIISILVVINRIIITIPSRLLFGRCTRFWASNILPMVKKFYYQQAMPVIPSDRNFHLELKKNGFLRIKGGISDDLYEKLKCSFNSAVLNPAKHSWDIGEKSIQIVNPIEAFGIDNLRSVMSSPPLKKILTSYFKTEYHVDKIAAYRTYPAESNDYVYSNFWHLDDEPCTCVKVFIFLSKKVDMYTGATRVVKLEDSKSAIRLFKFIDTSINKSQEINIPYDYISGEIGDIGILSASRCLHAATTIKTLGKYRDIISLRVDVKGSFNSAKIIN